MVLEATIICVDNSEWMRNGDFTPSRFESLKDAVNLVTGSKTQANAQSAVGLITIAGNTPSVLCTLTSDPAKILAVLHKVKLEGQNSNFAAALQVAQLALKHRSNKQQEQRIIVFVGSPIQSSSKELEQLGLRLKKNKVAVDVINFGEENREKLEAFNKAVNNDDNSHLLCLIPGGTVTDMLISSPIINSDGGTGTGGGGFEFGVDPNVDPELAMVLRLSMEEEERRKSALQAEKSKTATTGETTSTETKSTTTTSDAEMTEAKDEQQAPASNSQETKAKVENVPPSSAEKKEATMDEDDEDLKMALELSLQNEEPEPSGDMDLSAVAQDPEFIKSVIEGLPGVDVNDPSIKSVLESIAQEKKDDKKDDKQEKENK
eukprot:TRINITY_DN11522_c0_g1_i1.p1 TRINITY_DN11522_c0_g1~~TRINITY_DN11522_c0_g1_i1.p1  ORF type:complete len:376 (+),score=106.68 TRINITY_DN11522_c0_g1_i1:97-1224(+)